MVAFLTLHYAFYPMALIVFGVLLRTGVLNGKDSVELTIIPAGGRRAAAGPRRPDRADPARPRAAARAASPTASAPAHIARERRQSAGDAGRGVPLRARPLRPPLARAAWR